MGEDVLTTRWERDMTTSVAVEMRISHSTNLYISCIIVLQICSYQEQFKNTNIFYRVYLWPCVYTTHRYLLLCFSSSFRCSGKVASAQESRKSLALPASYSSQVSSLRSQKKPQLYNKLISHSIIKGVHITV